MTNDDINEAEDQLERVFGQLEETLSDLLDAGDVESAWRLVAELETVFLLDRMRKP